MIRDTKFKWAIFFGILLYTVILVLCIKLVGLVDFKSIFTWAIGIGFVFYALFLASLFTTFGVNHDVWKIMIRQFLSMIIFPSACFASLVVVMVLDQASGDIEFSGLGFQFKGAAAPLVLWAMLVMVMSISLRLLWIQNASDDSFSEKPPKHPSKSDASKDSN